MVVRNTSLGAVTDREGRFALRHLPPGTYAISFSMVGFATELRRDIALAPGDTVRLNVALRPALLEMPDMVVAASKRPRDIVDVPTSVSLIAGDAIRAQNALTLDQSLKYAPGVHMVSGQVNIRGASGYARGAGSRVLMLIDGFPALSADQGDVKWDAIPIGQIERVEIIKGAGSALYGTGALGGIVNVITRNPSSVPETRVRAWAGMYSDPAYPEWRWTDDRRLLQGIDISHSRQVDTWGFVAGAGQRWTNGYRQNNWHRRYNAFAKVRKTFADTRTLAATANWAYDDYGVYIQWKDRNEPLEVPASNRDDRTRSNKLNVNFDYYHLHSARMAYRLKTFVFRTHFDNDLEGDGFSTAYKFGQEIQLDLQPASALSLTFGVEGIGDRVASAANLFGDHTGHTLAAYAQAEWNPVDPLVLSAGGRIDRSKTDEQDAAHSVSPKLGLSWSLAERTTLRSTLGWGFRGPSIAEIYTQATFSGVPIAPNPDLKPERARSAEVGINQRFSRVQIDMAGFYSRYRNLIEARPDDTGVIRFSNVSRGRITGVELSAQTTLGPVRADASYTFMDAVEHLPTGDMPLPYRSRHLAGAGGEYTRGRLTAGARWTYRSPIRRGAALFPEGTRDLVAVYLLDLSMTYAFRPVDATFTVHNALQHHYAEVERNMAPPRRFMLSLSSAF